MNAQARAYLDSLPPAPPLRELGAEEARRAMEATALALGGEPEAVAAVEEVDAGGVPARLYRPAGGEREVVVWFHGGGWVLGSLDTHDTLARALAHRAGCAVLAVDYRLAPEHRFPAAVDDAWAATAWAAERFDGVAVGGDSAGGNLAAVVGLRARDRGLDLALQILVYPIADCDLETPSYREFADGFGLTRDAMRWFWEQYIPDEARWGDPEASPLRADSLAGMAPALVVTAEHDVLRDEGESYARRLEAEGVQVTLRRYDGQIHGFYRMIAVMDDAGRALDESAAALRRELA